MLKTSTILLLVAGGVAAAFILRPRQSAAAAESFEVGGTSFNLQPAAPGIFNLGAPDINLALDIGGSVPQSVSSPFDFLSLIPFFNQGSSQSAAPAQISAPAQSEPQDAISFEDFFNVFFRGEGAAEVVDEVIEQVTDVVDAVDAEGGLESLKGFVPFNQALFDSIVGQNAAPVIDTFDEGGGFDAFTGDGDSQSPLAILRGLFGMVQTRLPSEIPDFGIDALPYIPSLELPGLEFDPDFGFNPFDGFGDALSDAGQTAKYVAVGTTGVARVSSIATRALPFVVKGAFPILSKLFLPLLLVDAAATGVEFATGKNIPVIGNRELILDIFGGNE